MAILLSVVFSTAAALAQPAAKNLTPSATLQRTWVEHNKTEGGKPGMKIHTAFKVFGMKGVSSYLQIKFMTQDDKALMDTNDEFVHKDGSVAAFGTLEPGFDPTLYEDHAVFMPYDELDITTPGRHLLRMDIDVIYKDGRLVQHLTFHDFEFTKPAAVVAPAKTGSASATFQKFWVDHDVTEGGKRGMRLHTTFKLFGMKGISAYLQIKFLKSDNTPLMDRNNEFEHKDGSVAAFGILEPGYDSTIFENYEVFMPYAELDLASGKHNLKMDVDVIYEAGELIQHLTIYEFEYTKP